MKSRKNLRSWARLRLLSCAGLDVMSAAPELFAVVHELVPGAACALFLTDADGTPHGFHHEDSPAAVRSLFQAEPQLFNGPDELNVFQLVGRRGSPKVGQLLEPPRSYFASNTFQLLVRASGHHHALDVRLEPDGTAAGMLALFRAPGRGFDSHEAAQAQRIGLHLEHALRAQPAGGAMAGDLPASFDEEAMLVARPDGSVMFASDAAHAMLDALPLVGPAWPDRRRLPLLALRLVERLRDPARFPDRLPFARWAVAGGFIEATAQWLGAHAGGGGAAQAFAEGLVGIVLRRRSPEPLRVWRRLRAAALSPRAMEAAFWLALTRERDAVRARMGLSEAVMKDCLKAIYAELGVSSVAEVVGALRSDGAAAMPGALARVPAGDVPAPRDALRLAA